MNKIEEIRNQEVNLVNRSSLQVTCVDKLESLNPNEFIVYTGFGKMSIKGQDLEMKVFDVEKGNLSIIGKIFSIEYLDKIKEKEKGFLQKLFK